ncbi:ABC transporter permease [Gorillibacterium timonense]|uniref:ABC transporter permease n=1 Tax=Gorillibacterium timonense TaxID=1689269 RepID=UPI00071D012C|nr:ABC transporter permease [Gorillibacterium timonense]
MRNTLQIAWKEIKVYLRHKQTFAFMVAFPIALMMVLGFALSSSFSSQPSMGHIELLYKDTVQNAQLQQAWQSFKTGLEERGMKWEEIKPAVDGTKEVAHDRYTAYLEVSDDGIRYVNRETGGVENNIVQGMLISFADRYNLTIAAFGQSPEIGAEIVKAGMDNVPTIKESSLNPDREPGAMDYYAMAMSTMIAFYACISSNYLIRGERVRHTDIRLLSSPLSKAELFAGKVIGSTVVNFILVLIVVLFSRLVFKAEWGSHYLIILAVLFTEVLFAVSLGLASSYLIKGEGGEAAMIIITQIISFLGGAYFPISELGDVFTKIAWISPIRWAHQALIDIVYNNQVSAAVLPISLNIGVSVLLLAISAVLMRRKEGL